MSCKKLCLTFLVLCFKAKPEWVRDNNPLWVARLPRSET
jgi:hypothetical protein